MGKVTRVTLELSPYLYVFGGWSHVRSELRLHLLFDSTAKGPEGLYTMCAKTSLCTGTQRKPRPKIILSHYYVPYVKSIGWEGKRTCLPRYRAPLFVDSVRTRLHKDL